MNSGYYFAAPYEFLIDFIFFDSSGNMIENNHIPKIGRGVIINLEVMYNPNGEWSTFADGSPVSTQLTMTFREMRVIDSKNIANGY